MGERNRTNHRKNQHQLIYRILFVVFVVALLVVCGVMIYKWQQQKRANNKYEQLASQASETNHDIDETQTESETEEPQDILAQLGIEVPEKNLDWDALHSENADIYAWLYVPGTDVDYPVLQHPTDDTYYLKYNIDGTYGRPGCIYSEHVYNGRDFLDYNTVLYGHDMSNGTMFHTLHNFEDAAFFDEYRYAYIYMPDQVLVYDIFAAYVYTNEHIMYANDFSSEEGFAEYLDKILGIRDMTAHFREGVEVTSDNHIVTFSTCMGNHRPSERYIVQGVLINDPTLDYTE